MVQAEVCHHPDIYEQLSAEGTAFGNVMTEAMDLSVGAHGSGLFQSNAHMLLHVLAVICQHIILLKVKEQTGLFRTLKTFICAQYDDVAQVTGFHTGIERTVLIRDDVQDHRYADAGLRRIQKQICRPTGLCAGVVCQVTTFRLDDRSQVASVISALS